MVRLILMLGVGAGLYFGVKKYLENKEKKYFKKMIEEIKMMISEIRANDEWIKDEEKAEWFHFMGKVEEKIELFMKVERNEKTLMTIFEVELKRDLVFIYGEIDSKMRMGKMVRN